MENTNINTISVNNNTTETKDDKRKFSLGESIYAWFCLLIGYLVCKAGSAVAHPFGMALVILALFIVTAAVLIAKKFGRSKASWVIFISAVIAACSIVLTANETVQIAAWAYCFAAYGLFVYTATGNSLAGGFSNYIAADIFRAVAVVPFACILKIFSAMRFWKSKGNGMVAKILVGLAVALVPTAVVLILLSYDQSFTRLLDEIFSFEFRDVLENVLYIGLGIPVAMYLFGMFVSARNKTCENVMPVGKWGNASRKMRVIPTTTAVAAVLPILFIYVVFFISQWQYYVSGFRGVLPEGISYTDYAREGFFQLCAVAVINLVIVAVISLMLRRKSESAPLPLRVISIVFSLATVLLISTAMSKMIMYIDCYGLTRKRVYASWFMVLLAIIFAVIILKQFISGLKVMSVSAAICAIMFLGLAVSNVDSFIACYNVNSYINGELDTVDVEAMVDLGDSAVPHMVTLAEHLGVNETNGPEDLIALKSENELKAKVRYYLYYVDSKEDRGLFEYTLPAVRAEEAMQRVEADWESLDTAKQSAVYYNMGCGDEYREMFRGEEPYHRSSAFDLLPFKSTFTLFIWLVLG